MARGTLGPDLLAILSELPTRPRADLTRGTSIALNPAGVHASVKSWFDRLIGEPTCRPSELFSRCPTPAGGSDESSLRYNVWVGPACGLGQRRSRCRGLYSGLERARPDCQRSQQATAGHDEFDRRRQVPQ